MDCDLTANADKRLIFAQRPYNFSVIGIFTGGSREMQQEELALLTVCPQYKLLIMLYIVQEQLI